MFSIILAVLLLALLVMVLVQTCRVVKRIRKKDGEAALRENRRLAAALAALCVCYVLGRTLSGYINRDGASVLECFIGGVKDVLFLAVCGILACCVFWKKGMALKEENQSD